MVRLARSPSRASRGPARRAGRCALLAGVALIAAACGGASDVTDAAPAPASAPAADEGPIGVAERYRRLADAFDGEALEAELLRGGLEEGGSVLLYSSDDFEVLEALKGAFEARYPGLRLDYVELGIREMDERVLAEARAGRPQADVVSTTAPGVATYLSEGLTAPHHGIVVPAGQVEAYATDHTVVTRIAPQVIPWFGRTAELRPTSWDDYLTPPYAGCALSTAETWYVTLVAARGEAGAEAWLEAFFANGGIVGGRSTQDVRSLLAGEVDCLVFAPVRDLAEFADQGVDVGWSAPDATSVATIHAQVLASTPRPHAAALFVRWLAGPEAAAVYADLGELPVSPGVTLRPSLQPWVTPGSPESSRLRPIALDEVRGLQGTAAALFETWITPRLAG